MDQQTFSTLCKYFNMVHGVTIRAIDAFTDGELDFRPKPNMRTPRELIFHVYSQEKILAEAVQQGRCSAEAAGRSNPEEEAGKAEVQALVTVNDLRTYAQSCHQTAQSIFSSMPESQLNQPVESPFGTFPAWRYFAFTYDEHWHHRGQIYTYLRLLGKQPPMLYDY
ncbi:MAG: DinB family protein [Acidobacteria bacterium]|nr:DinB family protein [Acidobacteriota bacterium]